MPVIYENSKRRQDLKKTVNVEPGTLNLLLVEQLLQGCE